MTGPPRHVHHGHDETFYVVEGDGEFTIGHDRLSMLPGSLLYGTHNDEGFSEIRADDRKVA